MTYLEKGARICFAFKYNTNFKSIPIDLFIPNLIIVSLFDCSNRVILPKAEFRCFLSLSVKGIHYYRREDEDIHTLIDDFRDLFLRVMSEFDSFLEYQN